MKVSPLYPLLALMGGLLPSCVYYANPVPEMPYRPMPRRTAVEPSTISALPAVSNPEQGSVHLPTLPSPAPTPEVPWATALPGAKPISPSSPVLKPDPAPVREQKKQPEVKPVSTHITQPIIPDPPKVSPQPAPKVTPQIIPPQVVPEKKPITKPEIPAVLPPASSKKNEPNTQDLSSITNDGPIPYATRVEGDPTRVYNPLNPSKTIRIIDKNGNIYPSGKELKVKGTNYHFYVP